MWIEQIKMEPDGWELLNLSRLEMHLAMFNGSIVNGTNMSEVVGHKKRDEKMA